MELLNPFLVSDYHTPQYFCNRNDEKDRLISAVKNGRNVTLLSYRRLGKTGLIKHTFNSLKKEKNYRVLYIDIFSTKNLNDFVQEFASALVKDENDKGSNFLKKVSQLVSGVRGKIILNDITGIPELEVAYSSTEDTERSLSQIFQYLANQKERYVIALDEFQQINSYPERNIEAILRTHIQHQHKDNFIFSGSNKHLLTSIFSEYGRPFYASTDFMELGRLDKEEYTKFIHKHFKKGGRKISIELITEVLDYLNIHTYYVQYFFNKLYSMGEKQIELKHINFIKTQILKENEYVYFNYRALLTSFQFDVLKSIAKEDGVKGILSKKFIGKYNLGQPSSVSKTVKALVSKELLYVSDGKYKVYDVFFDKWLAK